MEPALTEDALLGGRVRLLQPRRGYRVAVDAVLLAAAIDAAPGERVLDLGAGVGAVGLCLAARVPGLHGRRHRAAAGAGRSSAERNATLNGLSDRVRTIVHDLARPLPAELGSFDHVVTNPPYLAAAVADPSPDPSKALATVESSADLARWLEVATGAAETCRHPDSRSIAATGWRRSPRIWSGWAGATLTIKRLPPAARVLVRARRAAAVGRANRRRSCCIGRKAATPTRPRRSCVTPLPLAF